MRPAHALAGSGAQGAPARAIGYVMRMFPQLSETFVANEVRELERQGISIRIFSYRRPRADVPHECVRSIRSPLAYLPDPLYRHPRSLARAWRGQRVTDGARQARAVGYVRARSLEERSLDPWRRLVQALHLAERLRGGPIVHLHAHFAHGATDVAMLASWLTGLPFGFTAHARDIYLAPPSRLAEKIRAAAYVVTCTRANQHYLRALVSPPERAKIELAYHGVDLEKFQPAPGERPAAEVPLVLAAGRLVPKKGFGDLLRACARLRARGVRLRCRIVGEGPERRRLAALARELGLADAVELPGSTSQEELADLYRRATVFVLPCRVLADGDRDGIPNVLAEAMASGLAVVSTRISGIPELVTSEENGLLVEPEEPAALAAALERLLADAPLRARLAAEARRTVERRFDSQTSARWLAQFFRERGAGEAPT